MQDRITDVRRELAINVLLDAEQKIEEARLLLLQTEDFDAATALRVLRRQLNVTIRELIEK